MLEKAETSWNKLQKQRGVKAKIAKALGLNKQAVHHWKKNNCIPINRVDAVSKLFGIPHNELYPDYFQVLKQKQIKTELRLKEKLRRKLYRRQMAKLTREQRRKFDREQRIKRAQERRIKLEKLKPIGHMTKMEFCVKENLSMGTLNMLERLGLAPKSKGKYISEEEYKKWIDRMERAAGNAPRGKKRHMHALRLAKIRGVAR